VWFIGHVKYKESVTIHTSSKDCFNSFYGTGLISKGIHSILDGIYLSFQTVAKVPVWRRICSEMNCRQSVDTDCIPRIPASFQRCMLDEKKDGRDI